MSEVWNRTQPPLSAEAIRWICSKVEGVDFGDVKITIRGSQIVQIDLQLKERHHEVELSRTGT